MSAVISDGTDTYRVEPVEGDLHAMAELDPLFSPGPPDAKDVIPAPPSSTLSPDSSPDLGAAAASIPPTIDVLVAYISSVPNAVTRIQQAMNETNQAFINSAGLAQRVNLVAAVGVSYTQHPTDIGIDLSRLAGTTDTFLDNLHGLRDTYDADIVALVVPSTTNACGVGYMPPSTGSPTGAFQVTSAECMDDSYTFTHETGHVLGGHHNPEDDQGYSPTFPYGYGHWVVGTARSVMSYDRCGCPRSLQFSSPVVDFIGHPGVRSGISGQRDNAASLNNMAYTIANYRVDVSYWQLRNSNTGGSPQINFVYGNMGVTHLACDYDGDGISEPVVFDRGAWAARSTLTAGPATTIVAFGYPGVKPVCGDWNGDGVDGIGIFDGTNWQLRQTLSPGNPELSFAFGFAGVQPVVGNWDGVGGDGIGIYNAGAWDLRQAPSAGPPQITFAYGYAGATPVTGNWDGMGTDGVAVYSAGRWDFRQTPSAGSPNFTVFYGYSATKPVTGDWNNDNADTLGVIAP